MSFLVALPRYRPISGEPGEIYALKVAQVIENPRGYELHFEDRRFVPLQVSTDWVGDATSAVGNYWVMLPDGTETIVQASLLEATFVLSDTGQAALDVMTAYRTKAYADGKNPETHRDTLVRQAAGIIAQIQELDLAAAAGKTQPVPEASPDVR